MPEEAVTWILTVLCETKHLLPSTSLQRENASTWLHNILLAQLTNKGIGQLGCQDLTLSALCHLSCWTQAGHPPLSNKLWGHLRKAPGSCCRVCFSSGMLLVCLLSGFAVRGKGGSERSHWGCSVLVGRDLSNAEARAAPARVIEI